MISIDRPSSHGLHFLDFKTLDTHAVHNIGKQSNHIVVAHGHVCNNLLESDLFGCMVLVFLSIID